MRRLLWILFFLIISVWIGLKIAADPGIALFSWQNWSIEMPLWFAALVLIIILFILYFMLRFFSGIGSSWHALGNWLRKKIAYSHTHRGLIELLEGQWKYAEADLLKGVAQSDAPLINYLAAAKAAHERGAYDRRDSYLEKAHRVAPQENIAIGLTQAQLQLQQGQVEQALATLNQLGSIAPKQVLVLKLLERLYIHLGDWQHILKLLPALRKAKFTDNDYLDKLELTMYEELLKSAAHKTNDKETIDEIWHSIPRKLQKNPQLIRCYVNQIFKYPEAAAEIEKLIHKILLFIC